MTLSSSCLWLWPIWQQRSLLLRSGPGVGCQVSIIPYIIVFRMASWFGGLKMVQRFKVTDRAEVLTILTFYDGLSLVLSISLLGVEILDGPNMRFPVCPKFSTRDKNFHF